MTRLGIVTAAGAALSFVGIAWLAPLMLDQLTFFGDREQEAAAATARELMVWPAGLLVGGVALLVLGGQPKQAAAAALPLVAVVLAWAIPRALWQLVVYAATAPVAIGALLAAVVPLRADVPTPLALGVTLGLCLAAGLATGWLAAFAAMWVIAWLVLSWIDRGRSAASTLD